MSEYYPQYSEVPKDVYEQVKGLLRGYDRLKKERLDLVYASKQPSDGIPRGSGISTTIEEKGIKLAYIDSRLEAVIKRLCLCEGSIFLIMSHWGKNFMIICQHTSIANLSTHEIPSFTKSLITACQAETLAERRTCVTI